MESASQHGLAAMTYRVKSIYVLTYLNIMAIGVGAGPVGPVLGKSARTSQSMNCFTSAIRKATPKTGSVNSEP